MIGRMSARSKNRSEARPTTDGREEQRYTIDELSDVSATTVRNIRAYQDRGLIPPPQRRGRVGIYNNEHLARLRVIAQMLERGYTLASIGDLFDAIVLFQRLNLQLSYFY